jgi:hypothetical protein
MVGYNSLPDRSKAWRAFGNSVQSSEATGSAHAAQAWVIVKNLFLGGGMVCAGSSNSVAAGMDGVDRIISKANVVSASGAVAHSWQVLECVADGWQVLIDFNTANNWTATLVWSPGGLFTGGSVTARPTASDEIVNRSALDWCIGNATNKINWTLIVSEDGQNFILTGGITTGLAVSWMMGRLENPRSWLTLPFYCNQMAAVTLTVARYTNPSGGNHEAFSVRTVTSAFIARCRCSADFQGSGFTSSLTGANSFTGGYDVVQTGLIQYGNPDQGRLGTLPDHLFCSALAHGTISQDPARLSVVAIQMGPWVLPWPLNSSWTVP